jgi:spore maturation protein CgeB
MYLEPLAETDIELALYGPGWEDTPLADHHRGSAYGPELYQAIHSSEISVNVHHRVQLSGGNLKTFEIPVSGALQIADACDPEWFVDREEIVLVESPDELRERVTYYLEHDDEREAIARRGMERAETDHTYENRVERLHELITEDSGRPDGVVDPSYLDEYSIL